MVDPAGGVRKERESSPPAPPLIHYLQIGPGNEEEATANRLPGPLFHRLFLLMAFQMKSKEGHKTWEQRLPANLLIHQLAVREIQVPAGESVPGLLYLEEATVTNG